MTLRFIIFNTKRITVNVLKISTKMISNAIFVLLQYFYRIFAVVDKNEKKSRKKTKTFLVNMGVSTTFFF